jgi:hypothetical protein
MSARWFIAGLALVSAAPAAAQSQVLLDCAVGSLDSGYRVTVADAAMRGSLAGVTGRLTDAVNQCADSHDLTWQQRPGYYQYSLGRVERDEFERRLRSAGIPTDVLDDALGFGAGRANPLIEGSLTDQQINTFYAALRSNGVDVKAVAKETWGLIGVYYQASSTMWDGWKKLR